MIDWLTLTQALPEYNRLRQEQGRPAVELRALSNAVAACDDETIAFKPGGGQTSMWLVNRERLDELIPPPPGRPAGSTGEA